MISKKFETIFMFINNFGYYFMCSPFKWARSKSKLVPSHPWARIIWHCICLGNAFWRLIIAIIMMINVFTFKITDSRIILCFMIWCYFLMAIIMYCTLGFQILHWRSLLLHVNSVFRIDRRFSKLHESHTHDDETSKHKFSLELETHAQIIGLGLAACELVAVPVVLFLLEFEPEIFYFIKTDYIELNFLLAVLAAAAFFVDEILIFVFFCTLFCHFKVLQYWISRISWKPKPGRSCYKVHTKLEYRQLQLLHNHLMTFLGPILPCMAIILVLFTITLIFFTIRFGLWNSSVHVFLSLGSASVSAVLIDLTQHNFYTFWRIIKACRSYCRSFQNKWLKKGDKKFLKSCQQMDVRIGFLFIIYRGTFIQLIGSVIIPTVINLLITIN